MSSIDKADVAARLNSGNAIVGDAVSGKTLPPSSKALIEGLLQEQNNGDIEPQDVKPIMMSRQELDPASYGSGSQGTISDSVSLRDRELASAITKLNDFVQNEQRDLEFAVNEEAGIAVVKVVSRQTGELIREIPGDEVVDLARKLNDQEPIRLFSAQV